jgi:hypothetical protein
VEAVHALVMVLARSTISFNEEKKVQKCLNKAKFYVMFHRYDKRALFNTKQRANKKSYKILACSTFLVAFGTEIIENLYPCKDKKEGFPYAN